MASHRPPPSGHSAFRVGAPPTRSSASLGSRGRWHPSDVHAAEALAVEALATIKDVRDAADRIDTRADTSRKMASRMARWEATNTVGAGREKTGRKKGQSEAVRSEDRPGHVERRDDHNEKDRYEIGNVGAEALAAMREVRDAADRIDTRVSTSQKVASRMARREVTNVDVERAKKGRTMGLSGAGRSGHRPAYVERRDDYHEKERYEVGSVGAKAIAAVQDVRDVSIRLDTRAGTSQKMASRMAMREATNVHARRAKKGGIKGRGGAGRSGYRSANIGENDHYEVDRNEIRSGGNGHGKGNGGGLEVNLVDMIHDAKEAQAERRRVGAGSSSRVDVRKNESGEGTTIGNDGSIHISKPSYDEALRAVTEARDMIEGRLIEKVKREISIADSVATRPPPGALRAVGGPPRPERLPAGKLPPRPEAPGNERLLLSTPRSP